VPGLRVDDRRAVIQRQDYLCNSSLGDGTKFGKRLARVTACTDIMQKIYSRHPDLAPKSYRSGWPNIPITLIQGQRVVTPVYVNSRSGGTQDTISGIVMSNRENLGRDIPSSEPQRVTTRSSARICGLILASATIIYAGVRLAHRPHLNQVVNLGTAAGRQAPSFTLSTTDGILRKLRLSGPWRPERK
jgi:hypothetical protein